jgi:hypothetical protein
MLVLLSYRFWAAPRIVPKESHRGDFLGELHAVLYTYGT